jgi:hypothetical protein
MFRLLAWIMAASFAFAGWRNLPRLDHPQASAAGVGIGACILLSYYAGTRRKRDAAVAVAVARAEARAAAHAGATAAVVNHVAVVVPERGARAAGATLGLDDAPWLVGAHRAIELDEREAVEAALADVLDPAGES